MQEAKFSGKRGLIMSKAKELQDKLYSRIAISMDTAKDPGSFTQGFCMAMSLERLNSIIAGRKATGRAKVLPERG